MNMVARGLCYSLSDSGRELVMEELVEVIEVMEGLMGPALPWNSAATVGRKEMKWK